MTHAEAHERALKAGNHWFDPKVHEIVGITMETEVFPNNCFVTSEVFPTGPERWYLVYRASEDFSDVNWLGEIYPTLDMATFVARNLK